MAKQRMINTSMWKDEYFQELNPTEKLLFIYLLTNESVSICGIYKVTLKTISFETGINKGSIEKALDRFLRDNKIFYFKGWIKIVNFVKNQNINPKVQKGIEIALSQIPTEIQIGFDSLYIPYEDINLNSNLNSNSNLKYQADFEFIWKQYPSNRRKDKDDCKKIYNDYCTSEEKEAEFKQSFFNYVNGDNFKKGFVLNSDKFFKSWITYLDYDHSNEVVKENQPSKEAEGCLTAE